MMRNQQIEFNSENQQPHSLKLTRMRGELSGMLSKLKSYKCEPCTSEMYTQFMDLEDQGKKLQQAIQETRMDAQEVAQPTISLNKKIHIVLHEYDRFQMEISSYFSEATMHH